jgi:hypothetical protein
MANPHHIRRFMTACAGALGTLALFAACGSPAAPASAPPSDAVSTSESAASDGDWRTDLQVGGIVGQVSYATPVLLADSSTATLEELADGKPLLLYFFATW